MKLLLLTVLCTFCFLPELRAEDVNITAEEKVEWHQKEQKIVAVGDAVATKEDMSIRADRLIGYYAGRTNSTKGKSAITKVEARGKVVMKSPRASAFGNTMDYDLIQDVVILRGNPARIETETESVTAKDNITYYPQEQKAVAFGNVEAVDKEGNHLYSDKMIAFFKKSAASDKNSETQNMELEKVEIYGNVKIVTEDAVVTADKGLYLPQTGKVRLFDNIVIKQDTNILRGDQAETDLNTGISKLIASGKNQRVKGVFKEKSEKSGNKQTNTQKTEKKQ